MSGRIWVPLMFAAFALIGVGVVVGGVVLYHDATTGRPTQVKVDDCHYPDTGRGTGHSEICTGAWVVGGALVGGKGHVVIGSIVGATFDDVGHTLTVRIHGGSAYVRSVRLPIILLVMGLFIAAVFLYTGWSQFRRPG